MEWDPKYIYENTGWNTTRNVALNTRPCSLAWKAKNCSVIKQDVNRCPVRLPLLLEQILASGYKDFFIPGVSPFSLGIAVEWSTHWNICQRRISARSALSHCFCPQETTQKWGCIACSQDLVCHGSSPKVETLWNIPGQSQHQPASVINPAAVFKPQRFLVDKPSQ